MVTNTTREEIETNLGQVPRWIAELSEPAAEHRRWLIRIRRLGAVELFARERARVG